MERCVEIPAQDEFGLLPPGVWDCTLEQIEDRFVTNDHRRSLWEGLQQFLADEYYPSGLGFPIWIDGSFTRGKPLPEDIDIVLDLDGMPPEQAFPVALAWRSRHNEIKTKYHIDLWTKHPLMPVDLAAYFQYAGPKAAAEFKIDSRHPKGILRVKP